MGLSFSIIIDLILFTSLVASSIWLFVILTGYEGLIGRSFKIIGWGALLFGFSQILDKFLFQFFDSYANLIPILTHFLEVVSFLFIVYGFKLFLGK